MQIEAENHIQYQVKAMPYRTAENVIDNVVMTFVNIQPQFSQAEFKLRRFATVLEDSNDAIMVQDFEGRILAWIQRGRGNVRFDGGRGAENECLGPYPQRQTK